jgi:molecular chaperone DnaK
MVEEAERYAEDDRKRREEADKLNAADAICYQAERTLADFGDKIAEEQRTDIENILRETREALSKRDATVATMKAEALKAVLQEVGKSLYAQAPEGAPQPQPEVGPETGEARASGSGPGGRVVDAEYKESQGA